MDNQGAVQSDHVRLGLARDTTAQGVSEYGAGPDSHNSSNFCTVKSCRCQTAHVGKRKAVMGAGMNGEQVASERAICRGHYSCCTVLLLFCSLLHYKSVMSGFLSGPTFKWGGPTFKWGGPTFK